MTEQANIKADYLSEMGIQPWYPRVNLVNSAAPSIELVTEHPVDEKIEPTHQKAVIPDVVLREASNLVVESVPEKPALKSAKKSSSDTVIRFGLGVYVVGDYIIASSLVSQHESLQDQAWRLLQNILATFTTNEHPLIYHHSIFWPFFDNNSADQSIESATEYVDEFLSHLSEQYKIKKIIAFGGVLPKLKKWSPSSVSFNPEIHLVLPSLYKMLNSPEEKAKAWQLIQASPFK